MPPKRQLTHLKEARKLAKLRKIEDRSETLVEDTSFLLEDESTEGSVILYPKFHCELNFIERYSFFFPLYTPHNLTEPFTDFGVLPNIMLVRTANKT